MHPGREGPRRPPPPRADAPPPDRQPRRPERTRSGGSRLSGSLPIVQTVGPQTWRAGALQPRAGAAVAEERDGAWVQTPEVVALKEGSTLWSR